MVLVLESKSQLCRRSQHHSKTRERLAKLLHSLVTGAIQETWIEGYRTGGWTVTGWMLVGIAACCILMSLVLLWRKTGRIVDMVDDETQTLDEGTPDPAIPMKVMITKNGRAAHCRNDFPFLLKSYSIQTLSWCSHCDPSDALEKRT